jgi:hypothetical protein
MAVTEADKDEAFLRMSQMPRALWERWKDESLNGKREVTPALNLELLLFALTRDRAINPNLDAYTWLTPENKEMVRAKFYRAEPTE